MPRETIYGTKLPYGPDEPARAVVEVTWTPDGEGVEIATKCVRSDDGTDYVPMMEAIEPLPIVEARSGTPEDPDRLVGVAFEPVLLEAEGLARSGFYVELDRRALNKLVRVLRHARNQVYGPDE